MLDYVLDCLIWSYFICLYLSYSKGLQAARAGIVPGCCILAVEGVNVSSSPHEAVVTAIRGCEEVGNDTLCLSIGVPSTQQLTHYQFESTDDILLEVAEKVVESPFIFSVPARVRRILVDMTKLPNTDCSNSSDCCHNKIYHLFLVRSLGYYLIFPV